MPAVVLLPIVATQASLAPAAGRLAPARRAHVPARGRAVVRRDDAGPRRRRTCAGSSSATTSNGSPRRASTIRDRSSTTCPIVARRAAAVVAVLRWSPCRRLLDAGGAATGITARDAQVLAWALLPLLLFTVSVGKQPRYVLPMLAAARSAAGARHPPSASRAGRRARPVTCAGVAPRRRRVTGAAAGRAGLLVVRMARPAQLGAPLARRADAGVALRRRRLVVAALLAVVALALGARGRRRRGRRPRPWPCSRRSARRRGRPGRADGRAGRGAPAGASEPVGSYHVFVRNLVFYTHVQQTPLYSHENVRGLPRFARSRAVRDARGGCSSGCEQAGGRAWRRLGDVPLLRRRHRQAADVLLQPDPGRDLRDGRPGAAISSAEDARS